MVIHRIGADGTSYPVTVVALGRNRRTCEVYGADLGDGYCGAPASVHVSWSPRMHHYSCCDCWDRDRDQDDPTMDELRAEWLAEQPKG